MIIYLFGAVALLALLSSRSKKFVFPLRNFKDYYFPTRGTWYAIWNFGAPRNGHRHQGIDILPILTPRTVADLKKHEILAYGSGVVINSYKSGKYGYIIEIKHNSEITTRYVHLHTIFVKKGQSVSAGQAIGVMGWLGSSPNNISASHLHFEILVSGKPKNPLNDLKAVLLQ